MEKIPREKSCFVAIGKKCLEYRDISKSKDPVHLSTKECPMDSMEVDICYTDEPWINMPSVRHLPKVEHVNMSESNLILRGESLSPSVKKVTVSSKMPWNRVVGMKKRKDVVIAVNLEDYSSNDTEVFNFKTIEDIQKTLDPETTLEFEGFDEMEGVVPRPSDLPSGVRFDPYVPLRGRLQVKELQKYVSLYFFTMPTEPPNMP